MQILIYGSNGWIGQQFIKICKDHNVNYKVGLVHCENVSLLECEINEIHAVRVQYCRT